MKNNKAFTLVELLAVVAILTLIIVIITPKVFKQLKTAENVTDQEQINSLINTSKIYMNQNSNLLPQENNIYVISLDELKESGLIQKSQILNPSTNEELTGCIVVSYEKNKYKYEYTQGSGWCDRPQLVTSGDGVYNAQGEPGRLIYKGANPNNWIELNEGTKENPNYVKYRIISYEYDGTIKIVRDENIGDIAWDNEENNRNNNENSFCNQSGVYYGCNAWSSQQETYFEKNRLNTFFFYKYYVNNTQSEMIFSSNDKTVNKNSSINIYLNNAWLQEKNYLKEYVVEHDYYVGGINYYNGYRGGDKGILKEKQEEQTLVWNGKIGLVNVTEVVETSTNPLCSSVYSNYYYAVNSDGNLIKDHLPQDGWPCKNNNNNWLANKCMWTITAVSKNNYQIWTSCITFGQNGAKFANAKIHPAFYLRSDIKLTGEGTELNPYRIL